MESGPDPVMVSNGAVHASNGHKIDGNTDGAGRELGQSPPCTDGISVSPCSTVTSSPQGEGHLTTKFGLANGETNAPVQMGPVLEVVAAQKAVGEVVGLRPLTDDPLQGRRDERPCPPATTKQTGKGFVELVTKMSRTGDKRVSDREQSDQLSKVQDEVPATPAAMTIAENITCLTTEGTVYPVRTQDTNAYPVASSGGETGMVDKGAKALYLGVAVTDALSTLERTTPNRTVDSMGMNDDLRARLQEVSQGSQATEEKAGVVPGQNQLPASTASSGVALDAVVGLAAAVRQSAPAVSANPDRMGAKETVGSHDATEAGVSTATAENVRASEALLHEVATERSIGGVLGKGQSAAVSVLLSEEASKSAEATGVGTKGIVGLDAAVAPSTTAVTEPRDSIEVKETVASHDISQKEATTAISENVVGSEASQGTVATELSIRGALREGQPSDASSSSGDAAPRSADAKDVGTERVSGLDAVVVPSVTTAVKNYPFGSEIKNNLTYHHAAQEGETMVAVENVATSEAPKGTVTTEQSVRGAPREGQFSAAVVLPGNAALRDAEATDMATKGVAGRDAALSPTATAVVKGHRERSIVKKIVATAYRDPVLEGTATLTVSKAAALEASQSVMVTEPDICGVLVEGQLPAVTVSSNNVARRSADSVNVAAKGIHCLHTAVASSVFAAVNGHPDRCRVEGSVAAAHHDVTPERGATPKNVAPLDASPGSMTKQRTLGGVRSEGQLLVGTVTSGEAATNGMMGCDATVDPRSQAGNFHPDINGLHSDDVVHRDAIQAGTVTVTEYKAAPSSASQASVTTKRNTKCSSGEGQYLGAPILSRVATPRGADKTDLEAEVVSGLDIAVPPSVTAVSEHLDRGGVMAAPAAQQEAAIVTATNVAPSSGKTVEEIVTEQRPDGQSSSESLSSRDHPSANIPHTRSSIQYSEPVGQAAVPGKTTTQGVLPPPEEDFCALVSELAPVAPARPGIEEPSAPVSATSLPASLPEDGPAMLSTAPHGATVALGIVKAKEDKITNVSLDLGRGGGVALSRPVYGTSSQGNSQPESQPSVHAVSNAKTTRIANTTSANSESDRNEQISLSLYAASPLSSPGRGGKCAIQPDLNSMAIAVDTPRTLPLACATPGRVENVQLPRSVSPTTLPVKPGGDGQVKTRTDALGTVEAESLQTQPLGPTEPTRARKDQVGKSVVAATLPASPLRAGAVVQLCVHHAAGPVSVPGAIKMNTAGTVNGAPGGSGQMGGEKPLMAPSADVIPGIRVETTVAGGPSGVLHGAPCTLAMETARVRSGNLLHEQGPNTPAAQSSFTVAVKDDFVQNRNLNQLSAMQVGVGSAVFPTPASHLSQPVRLVGSSQVTMPDGRHSAPIASSGFASPVNLLAMGTLAAPQRTSEIANPERPIEMSTTTLGVALSATRAGDGKVLSVFQPLGAGTATGKESTRTRKLAAAKTGQGRGIGLSRLIASSSPLPATGQAVSSQGMTPAQGAFAVRRNPTSIDTEPTRLTASAEPGRAGVGKLVAHPFGMKPASHAVDSQMGVSIGAHGAETDVADADAGAAAAAAARAAVAEIEAATEKILAGNMAAVNSVVTAMNADFARNANLSLSMAKRGELTSVAEPAVNGSSGASSVAVASPSGVVNTTPATASSATSSGTSTTTRTRARRSSLASASSNRRTTHENDPHDDLMHAMCMICLEMVSEPAEGGGSKLLGLLDSCSHRYCYPCILEWSKVTNKCPQCNSRFHTIKAVKEHRRGTNRYRGTAVTVEDRDQTYDFVDVRDVVVLDPDVECHPRCLLRGAVDPFQQRGWEFSVQCEHCSGWFHGVCVGFHEERSVPDRWFCNACGGRSYPSIQNNTAGARPAAAAGAVAAPGARGRVTSRGRIRGRGHGESSFEGQEMPLLPLSGQGRGGGSARDRGQCGSTTCASASERGGGKGSGLVAVTAAAVCTAAVAGTDAPAQLGHAHALQQSPPPPPQSPSPPPLRHQLLEPLQVAPPRVPPVPPRSRRQESPSPLTSNTELQPPPAAPVRGRVSPPVPPAPSISDVSPPPTSPLNPTPVPSPLSLGVERSRGNTENKSRARGGGISGRGRGCGRSQAARITSAPSRPAIRDGAESPDESPGRLILPARPTPSLLRELEAEDTTDLCDICGFDTEPDNLIVYCESCNMGVHQTCYGIPRIPTKAWYCSPCSAGVHPSTLSCRFCPVRGGALKRCTDGRWGHVLCAFWIPECCFIDPRKMEPIGSINKRGKAGGVEQYLPSFRFRMCHICGTSVGCSIRCHSCKFHLHPMCGSKAGNVYMGIETTETKEPNGEERGSVRLVAKCPRHHKGEGRAQYSRPRRSRSYRREDMASGADPLRVYGTTLEITDRARGVVLRGKVTWFDPVQSRYCIVESGNGESGSDCAHWITPAKLVEAKAMSIRRHSADRIVVEALSSLEGDPDADLDGVAATGSGEATGVKTEEEKEGGGLATSGNGKEINGANEEHLQIGELDPDETESEGEDGRASPISRSSAKNSAKVERRGKEQPDSRSRQTPSPLRPTSEREVEAAQPPEREDWLEESTEPAAPAMTHESERKEPTLAGAERVETDSNGYPNNAREIDAAQRNQEQQRELLPAVAVPGRRAHSSRYPLRLTRQRSCSHLAPARESVVKTSSSAKRSRSAKNPAAATPTPGSDPTINVTTRPSPSPLEATSAAKRAHLEQHPAAATHATGFESTANLTHSSPGSLDATSSAKRPRLGENASTTCTPGAEPTANVPQDSCVEGETCKSGVTADDTELNALAEHETVQEALPIDGENDVASVTPLVGLQERQATEPAHSLQPGWPGMDMFGQVPVMRVRSVNVSGGAVSTYFAGAYAPAGVASGSRRAWPRSSFRFEDMEQVGEAGQGYKRARKEEVEIGIATRGNENAHSSRPQELVSVGEPEEEQVEVCGQDTMPPSPPDSDVESLEDGEIETLEDGRANIMPPSPPDEEMESVIDMAWEDDTGDANESEHPESCTHYADKEPANGRISAPRSNDSRKTENTIPTGKVDGVEAADDMEISSEDQSGEELDGTESTPSSCEEDAHVVTTDVPDGPSPADPSDENRDLGDGDIVHVDRQEEKIQQEEKEGDSPEKVAESNTEVLIDRVTASSTDTVPTGADELAAKVVSNDGGVSAFASAEVCVSTRKNMNTPPVEYLAARDDPEVETPEVIIQSLLPPQLQNEVTTALRKIVREQIQDILLSASQGGEAALEDGDSVLEQIATDVEKELFDRLFRGGLGERAYKAKYKQLLLSLGNVRNYRLVASVLAGTTTAADLATKDAVGLLNSLNSNLNCLAIPLAVGRHKPGSPLAKIGRGGKANRRAHVRLR